MEHYLEQPQDPFVFHLIQQIPMDLFFSLKILCLESIMMHHFRIQSIKHRSFLLHLFHRLNR